MAVIKDYKSSTGARIIIHDDYMVKTPEENKAIVRQMSRVINGYFASPTYQKKLAEEQENNIAQ